MTRWWPLLLWLLLAGRAAAQAPDPSQGVALEQRLGDQIPLQLSFHEETGRPVALTRFFHDRPVILVLGYYECPMLCSQVLNGVVQSLQEVKLCPGADYELVVVSVNPLEMPQLAREKKAAYALRWGRPGAEEGWHFLTGQNGAIQALAAAVGFHYRYDPGSGQYRHASGIMVCTPQGRLSRYFYGIRYPPLDVERALRTASKGRLQRAVQQLLLLCYQYDPTQRGYQRDIIVAMRLAALTTLLALGGFVARSLRREGRHG